MADKKLSCIPTLSLSSSSHQNGKIRGVGPKNSPTPHQNSTNLDLELGHHSPTYPDLQPHAGHISSTSASTPPLRTLEALVTPKTRKGPECSSSSTRPKREGLGSDLSSRTRTTVERIKLRSSQHEEPEDLLDLILESQGQRLDDQRASLSLLPGPGSASLCGACSPDQPHLPSLDFYYMLIHYQSDRMEDQRCPLPDLDDVIESGPEGQEDFFSLIQRVQSRRMDEQRASILITHSEDNDETHSCGSSPQNHHH